MERTQLSKGYSPTGEGMQDGLYILNAYEHVLGFEVCGGWRGLEH